MGKACFQAMHDFLIMQLAYCMPIKIALLVGEIKGQGELDLYDWGVALIPSEAFCPIANFVI